MMDFLRWYLAPALRLLTLFGCVAVATAAADVEIEVELDAYWQRVSDYLLAITKAWYRPTTPRRCSSASV